MSDPDILRSLEDDPRNWMLKLPQYPMRPSLGLPTPPTTPPFSPGGIHTQQPISGGDTGNPVYSHAQPMSEAPRLTPGLSLPAPPTPAAAPTSLRDPNAPKQISLPTPPDPNDPKLQGPHGVKRVMLTLGAGILGGPFGDMAQHALHPYEAAEGRYRQQIADADTASQVAERQRQANLPAPVPKPQELKEVPADAGLYDPNKGEWLRQPSAKSVKETNPEQQTYDSLIKSGKTEEEALAAVKSAGQRAPTKTFEEQEYGDWAGKQPTGSDTSRMAFETARKKATETPEKPSGEDKAVSDHLAAQGLPNTPANRDKARLDLTAGKATAGAEAKAAETQKQLGDSAQQALKNMNAIKAQDTPASNYAFLMNFIGMSYEGVRGARLNRAEIERAAMTRTLPDALQHSYDLWVQRKQLTPQQKTDMMNTARALAGTYDQGTTGSKPGGAPQGKPGDPLGIL